jgi:hypothetical protein
LSFRNHADFAQTVGFATLKSYICGSHYMPAAEQTLKYLWRSRARAHLFAQAPAELSGDCVP